MTIKFFGGETVVWKELTDTATSAKSACVAVAFFGKGGAKQLPLTRGAILVVDASEARVKAGATCPEELLKLVGKGVEVYSYPNLHAKIFVFARKVFVGSNNVSASSKATLSEAMLMTTDTGTVHAARAYVHGLMRIRLGPAELERLQKVYRPPPPPKTTTKAKKSPGNRVWYEGFFLGDPPKGSEQESKTEEDEAQDKLTKGYELDTYWREGPPRYAIGDTIINYCEDNSMVYKPARVIHQFQWSNGKARYTFSYEERPVGHRISFDRMVKALGRGWKKRLSEDGKVKREYANVLLAWWHQRG